MNIAISKLFILCLMTLFNNNNSNYLILVFSLLLIVLKILLRHSLERP